MVNYYELLNVSRDATKEEIELALARCMLSPNKTMISHLCLIY